jgi:ABC-type bacteriocin/lantibiotic exporter with double-glycine peptidase domain
MAQVRTQDARGEAGAGPGAGPSAQTPGPLHVLAGAAGTPGTPGAAGAWAAGSEAPLLPGLPAVVEALAAEAGLGADPVEVRRAVADLTDDTPWLEALGRACAAARLALHPVQAPIREVLAHPTPSLVLPGREGWLHVGERRGGRARVRVLAAAGGTWQEPRWVSGPVLAAMAGAPGVAAPLTWVAGAAEAPLEPLARADHGGHGGGGGGHASPLARLTSLLWLEREDVGVVAVYAVAAGLLSLATPIAVQALVSTVAFGTLLQPLLVLAVLVMAALAFAAVLRALKVRVVEAIQQRLFVRVALDVAHRVPRVKAEAFDREYGPEVVNRFFDVLTVQKSASLLLLDGLTLVLQATIGMLVLAFYHPALLGFAVLLLAAAAGVLVGMGRKGPSTAIKESKAKYAVAAWLEELARNPLTFRSREGAAHAVGHADALARGWVAARTGHFRVVFRQTVGALGLQVLASGVLLGLGGWLVLQRQLTLGQLVAAELIVTAVLASVAKFGKKLEGIYDLLAALDKLGHLVDLPTEEEGPHREALPPGPGGLAVHARGASFLHPGTSRGLPPLTLSLQPGERVALVSGSGTGKSVLADLLYGLRTPEAGVLEVGGVDTRRASPGSLRAQVALVRGGEVLEGSVAENVALGRAGVGGARVREALDAVGLLEEVLALPEGLDTPLSAGGAPLTHGQVRRLVLARALAGRPRLLVLDGALDGMDVRARHRVMDALLAPAAPWTLLLLASEEDEVVRRVPRRHALAELTPDRPAEG